MSDVSILGRVLRHGVWRLERAYGTVADRMRRGDRTVIMTPPAGSRLGNFLYFWLSAYERSSAGAPTAVLISPEMRPWMSTFPTMRRLCVEPSEVRFRDHREWRPSYYQRFGEDFSRPSLHSFIRDTLAPFVPVDRSDRLVINVRRGDYYAEPHLRERYGFDQPAYIRRALDLFPDATHALVVSDDADWCREHLPPALAGRLSHIDYLAPDPLTNLLALGGARQLIGTNSTFSYWGGYIADALHADARIVMPTMHDRVVGAPRAYQLDPAWPTVDGPAERDQES